MAGDTKENSKNSPKSRGIMDLIKEAMTSHPNRPTGGGARRDDRLLKAEMKSFPEKKKKK